MGLENNKYYQRFRSLVLLKPQPRFEDEQISDQPSFTVGTIVYGTILRISAIIVLTWIINEYYGRTETVWTISMLLLWGIGVYPAFQSYKKFLKNVSIIKSNTLCGSCKHFNETNQLCSILDEHVSETYVPCEGLSWEPHSYGSRDEN